MEYPDAYPETNEMLRLIVRMSLLQSGFVLEDPHELASPVEKLVKKAMNIPLDEPVDPVDFTMSEDDPESESDEDKKGEEEPEAEEEEEVNDEEEEGEDQADDNNNEEAEAAEDTEEMPSEDL